MGIGDKLVCCASIQALSRAGFTVTALCNSSDREIFDACGIKIVRRGQVINWRDHVMGVPPGSTPEECEAADRWARHPVERAMWGLGIERYAPESVKLWIQAGHKKNRASVAWMPVEVSRRYDPILPMEWARVLQNVLDMLPGDPNVELWCAMKDQPQAMAILNQMPLAVVGRTVIRSADSFRGWADSIAGCLHSVTANCGGMWVALGVSCPVTVVQHPPANPHAAMWQAGPGWGVNLLATQDIDPP